MMPRAASRKHQSWLLGLIACGACLVVFTGIPSGSSKSRQTVEEQSCQHELERRKLQVNDLLRQQDGSSQTDQTLSSYQANAELAALRQDLEDALQNVEAAIKERDVARDLAASFVKDDKAIAAQSQEEARHTPWGPSVERDKQDPALAAVLEKVAINNEVMVAISNMNYAMPGGMLTTWIEGIKRAGVKNAMVVALDAQTKCLADEHGVTSHEMHLEISASQQNVGSNHAVSGLKFKILQKFLQLGYAVLLSDVDIVTLQNPFEHLYRDSDVEGMSDGWNNATAYGYNDVLDDAKMGWARYAHSMRVFVLNSGLFYIIPTLAASDLLQRIAHRLETEDGWDQAIFNEVIFFPSHGDHKDPAVTRRVMDYMQFMNSKTLFTVVRKDPALASRMPVTVHVNYHPDKHPRMLAVVQRYVDGEVHALDRFPDGSE